MLNHRTAESRGRANFGWLDSKHSFSFGSYYDPAHMGWSALRVINDDSVTPGAGFDTHGHRDMEIISLVTKGEIEHKDSMGHVQRLPSGEFQLMSAGRGVTHSEYNASKTDGLKFLQIWIEPNEMGGAPGYQQKDFGRRPGMTSIVTPDGRDGTLKIKQDASLSQLILDSANVQSVTLNKERRYYLHLIEGEARVGDMTLRPGDGLKIGALDQLKIESIGDEPVWALWFDLP